MIAKCNRQLQNDSAKTLACARNDKQKEEITKIKTKSSIFDRILWVCGGVYLPKAAPCKSIRHNWVIFLFGYITN